MNIDLLSPESFAAGHPFAQYNWLRENAPVLVCDWASHRSPKPLALDVAPDEE